MLDISYDKNKLAIDTMDVQMRFSHEENPQFDLYLNNAIQNNRTIVKKGEDVKKVAVKLG